MNPNPDDAMPQTNIVDQIARAVLYEGYLLYPYRASAIKNQQRWTFGGVYPKSFGPELRDTDPWQVRTECLAEISQPTTLTLKIRFLHLIERKVGRLAKPQAEWNDNPPPQFVLVDSLVLDKQKYQAWQEASEQEVNLEIPIGNNEREDEFPFSFPPTRNLEPLRDKDGNIAGVFTREQQSLQGVVKASVSPLEKNLWKITVVIQNLTPLAEADSQNRDIVHRQTFISTHTILHLRDGEFVSLLEPPEQWKAPTELCQNEGTWPVLVGQAGEKHTMLSSPIILYDYPEVAPESPGDFFDGTEIDEMLTLRILTMTDEEKQEMQTVDEHARQLLDRTESLAREQMAKLHGTLRGLRPLPIGEEHE